MSAELMEKNQGIVSRWIDEVFNAKRMGAIDQLKFSSYLDWTPFPLQQLDLPVSGLKKSLPEFFSALPDFRFRAEEMFAEGDMVVCLGSWSATHTGELMGIPPTGKRLSGTRIDIFRCAGDKMAEHWGCGSEIGMFQVLGTVPAEGDGAAAGDLRAIGRRFVDETLNRRSLAAVEELVDDHAVDHTQAAMSTFLLLTAFPDLKVSVDQVLADGDRVTVLSTFHGTHRGTFMGAAPTGKQVAGTLVDTFRIADGKIVESWRSVDAGGLDTQAN